MDYLKLKDRKRMESGGWSRKKARFKKNIGDELINLILDDSLKYFPFFLNDYHNYFNFYNI